MNHETPHPSERSQPISRLGRLGRRLFGSPELPPARPWSETIEHFGNNNDVTTLHFREVYALGPEDVLPQEPGEIILVAYTDRQALGIHRYGYVTNYEKVQPDGSKRPHLASFRVDYDRYHDRAIADRAELFEVLACDDDAVLFKFTPGDELMRIPAGTLQARSHFDEPLKKDDFLAHKRMLLDRCYEAVQKVIFGPPTDKKY